MRPLCLVALAAILLSACQAVGAAPKPAANCVPVDEASRYLKMNACLYGTVRLVAEPAAVGTGHITNIYFQDSKEVVFAVNVAVNRALVGQCIEVRTYIDELSNHEAAILVDRESALRVCGQ